MWAICLTLRSVRTLRSSSPTITSKCVFQSSAACLTATDRTRSTKVDISIDSFSGRNPSYCFVEFRSQEDADRAMSSLQGIDLLGRPIRINPKTERRSNPNGERTPNRSFEQRGWRPREGPTGNANGNSYSTDRWNRNDNYSQSQSQGEDPKRVYVGGLPQLPDQQSVEAEIRSLFAEYEVQAISKLISPHSINGNDTGSSNYCFVDLATPEQAADAVKCLNGRPTPHDGTYRVSPAKGKRSTGPVDREPQPPPPASTRVFISGLPAIESQAELDNQIRELFAGLDIKEVSKLIVPHESKQIESGNHHYCFATFERQEEAERAVEAMNGSPTPNGGTMSSSSQGRDQLVGSRKERGSVAATSHDSSSRERDRTRQGGSSNSGSKDRRRRGTSVETGEGRIKFAYAFVLRRRHAAAWRETWLASNCVRKLR